MTDKQIEGARDAARNEGDQRLIDLLTQAFGTRHPAIDDLASLILRANANARDASAQQDEREAFEAWWTRDVSAEYRDLAMANLKQSQAGDGIYGNTKAQSAWEGWQARGQQAKEGK